MHSLLAQDGWEDDEDDDNFTAQLRAQLDASDAAVGALPVAAAPDAMQQ